MMFDIRRVLEWASCYNLLQSVGTRARKLYIAEYLKPKSGQRILDIGCGPAQLLSLLPDVEYVGFDASVSYIQAARKRYGNRGTFHAQLVSEANLADPGTYDLVNASGLLHHLDDEEARALFRLAKLALKPEGRLVTGDNCFVSEQSRLARWLIRMDRGEYIRKPEAYRALARETFPQVEMHVRHDMLRPIPYTHVILVSSL